MAYFACFLVSFSLFYFSEDKKKLTTGAFWFLGIILVIYWTLLLGLQNNVGTDYKNYYKMFSDVDNTSRYVQEQEILFYSIIKFVNYLNLNPQLGFIIVAFIQAIIFFIFLKKIKLSRPSIFILVYFTVSTIFINQTNILRQSIAIYIFSVSSYFILKRKLAFFLITIGVAALFHRSAILAIPTYFLPVLTDKFRKPHHFILFLVFSFLLSMIDTRVFLTPVMRLTMYSHYLHYDRFYRTTSFINMLTKFIWIPFFLLSVSSLKSLNIFEKKLFSFGYFAYCFKLILLPYAIFTRFTLYFEILQVLPLYFCVKYFLDSKDIKKYQRAFTIFIIVIVMIGVFAAKTLFFPIGEYNYKSIISL